MSFARELTLGEEAHEPDHALAHFLRDMEEDYAEALAPTLSALNQLGSVSCPGFIPAAWLDAAESHFNDHLPDGLAWFAAFRRAAEDA